MALDEPPPAGTARIRPESRSATSAEASGRNAIPHGAARPETTVPATASDGGAVALGEGVEDVVGEPLPGDADCDEVNGALVGPLDGLSPAEHAATVSATTSTPAASRTGVSLGLARCWSMISTLGAATADVTPTVISDVSRYRLLP
jgi:hypothetical protein